MFEALLFGLVQGVAEWLPVSSEGLIVLLGATVFDRVGVAELIRFALFLHLGTFLAALFYFWGDVVVLVRSLVRYRSASEESRALLRFLMLATAASGLVGWVLFESIERAEEVIDVSGALITVVIGAFLLVTAILLLLKKRKTVRGIPSLTALDAVIVGVVQGFAVLPGLSRSGLTVSTLLLRRFDDVVSLRLSFLMSLPVVLGANIALNASLFVFSSTLLLALGVSFVLGVFTIHGLLLFARRVNIGLFVLVFALLMFASLLM